MKQKVVVSGFLGVLLVLSLVAYAAPASAQNLNTSGKPQLEYAFGKIPGKDIIVHVAVIVPPGFDKNDVIDQALKYQGAQRIQSSDYSLISSLKWNSNPQGGIPVTIKYNNNNEPVFLNGAGETIFTNAESEWNSVPTIPNSGIFSVGNFETSSCPSLAKECGGVADGENGFGWADIKQPSTLGATYWYTSSQYGLEVDTVLSTNKRIPWNTDGSNYDVFTVALHELGHALGLGHSETKAAVMYPSYQTAVNSLYQDDICGAQDLYGTQDSVCSNNTVSTGDVSNILVTFASHKNGLQVTLALKDNNNNPVDAKVKITLYQNDNAVGTGTASSSGGTVSFVKHGSPSGCYSIVVDEVNDSPYDGQTTFTQTNPYCV